MQIAHHHRGRRGWIQVQDKGDTVRIPEREILFAEDYFYVGGFDDHVRSWELSPRKPYNYNMKTYAHMMNLLIVKWHFTVWTYL